MVDTIKGLLVVDEARMYKSFWCSLAFSIIHLRLAMWSRVPLPRLYPACSIGSSGIRNTSSLLRCLLIFTKLINYVPAFYLWCPIVTPYCGRATVFIAHLLTVLCFKLMHIPSIRCCNPNDSLLSSFHLSHRTFLRCRLNNVTNIFQTYVSFPLRAYPVVEKI